MTETQVGDPMFTTGTCILITPFTMFKSAGIRATLGLVMHWEYGGGRIGRRPIWDEGWFEAVPAEVSDVPRAYTEAEVIDMLVSHVSEVADYWATTDLKRPEFGITTPEEDIRHRCRGVAFTVLSTLDGASLGLPGFDLIPTPHPSDKAYHEYYHERS
jgi:hypothetical protein